MVLRYLQSVQLGAYMWRKGLNWLKMGTPMGSFHLFVHPKMVHDHVWYNTFLSHF